MNKIWFKRKTYGWGWTPSTWQGWLVLFVWLIIFLFLETRMDDSNVLVNLGIIFILTAILIFICYKKGEKPKWQWGVKKEDALDNKKM